MYWYSYWKRDLSKKSLATGVLQEIARRCNSKVKFGTVVSTIEELQFSVKLRQLKSYQICETCVVMNCVDVYVLIFDSENWQVLKNCEKVGVRMGKNWKDAQQQEAENTLHNLDGKILS
ncbi:hypothetical protein BC332_10861 [Capsicum chinense]|nr:hypothetical protein BC332_10861 [Capsicum chinense]